MLATRHIEDFLIIHQFAQRNVVEETGQTIAQIAPQRVGQAFIAALTTAFARQRVASTDSSTALITSPTAMLPASLPSRYPPPGPRTLETRPFYANGKTAAPDMTGEIP